MQGRAGYYEFNLSPSSAWAVYGFDAYRSGMSSPDGVCLYTMEAMKTDDRYELSGEFDLDGLSNLAFDEPYSLGLSAVIEQTDGRKSYWALAHAPGKPDFHHPDAFAACLPPVEHS